MVMPPLLCFRSSSLENIYHVVPGYISCMLCSKLWRPNLRKPPPSAPNPFCDNENPYSVTRKRQYRRANAACCMP